MIRNMLIGFFALLLASVPSFAQTTIVNNPDGTLTIKSNTSTLTYLVDVNRKFTVRTSCNNATIDYNSTKNGTTAYKGSIVEVQVLEMPNPSTITPVPVNGFFQIWRSTDLVFTYDSTKLELIEAVPDAFSTDKSVVDITKISVTKPATGVAVFHSQCLPAPELRTPKLAAQPFQWNLGGFVWSNGFRNVGKLRFKVLTDFYYPTQSSTDIKILPELNINGTVVKSVVDGGAAAGTNVIGPIQNGASGIKFGPSPDYKFDLSLVGPTNQVGLGDTVNVKIMISPSTLPQILSYVATTFAWDKTKLEFMGIDKTGARAATMSSLDWVCPTCVNEASIPKDGTGFHNFLNQLGDKTPVAAPSLIVTLKFRVIADFSETTIEVINKTDPRVAGLNILDDTGIAGGGIGKITNAVIKGSLIIGTP